MKGNDPQVFVEQAFSPVQEFDELLQTGSLDELQLDLFVGRIHV